MMMLVRPVHRIQAFLNQSLRQWIDAGRRFIQNEDRGILQQDAAQRDQLPLPHREAAAPFADFCGQTLRRARQPVAAAHVSCGHGDDALSGYHTGRVVFRSGQRAT